jgi:hypothetical protein
MDVTKEIRTRYFQALKGLTYQGVEIPIFVGFLDDSASLPIIDRGEVYIVIQDQQAYDSATQPYCTYNVTSDITIRVISKFTKKGTTSVVEDIAMEVDNRIRGTIKKRDQATETQCFVAGDHWCQSIAHHGYYSVFDREAGEDQPLRC